MPNNSTTLLPPRFAVDYTGTNPDNLVPHEPHTLTAAGLAKRAVVPLYGPFFKDSVVVTDEATQQILNSSQYHYFNLVPILTELAPVGKEVYETIVITDTAVSASVTVSYQSVGGYTTQSMTAIKELLDLLYSDSRPVLWPNVLDTPDFTPTPHRHAISDGVGYEQLTVTLERLRQVIIMADSIGDDVILQYIDDRIAFYTSIIATNTSPTSSLGRHIANANRNPHNVTPADLHLERVKNYPIATAEEAIAGNLPNRYMTPSLVKVFVDSLLAYHFGNQNNPHGLTKYSVNLDKIENLGYASTAQEISNASANAPLYVTNLAVKAFLDVYLPQWEEGMRQQVVSLQQQVSAATTLANAALNTVNQDITQAVDNSTQAGASADASQVIATWCNNNVLESEDLARSLLNVYIDSYSVLNWVVSNFSQTADWRDICFGNDRFVAVAQGTSNKAMYSINGVNWQNAILPRSTNWTSVTYGNGVFVAVASASNVCASSTDGITWTEHSLPAVANWHDVGYGNGKFIAVAYGSTAAVSTDGITWGSATLPSVADWVSVTYGNGVFVTIARGSNKSAYSTDGNAWTAKDLPATSEWTAIVYGNGKFMAAAALNAEFASCTNGTDWIKVTLPSNLNLNWQSITYGDGKYFALANGSDKAAMSLDGSTWSERILPSSQQWIGCAYGLNTFIAIAKDSSQGAMSKPLDPV